MKEGVWEVGGDLVMSSARLVDAGEFRCVVNNSVGSITISTFLSVITPLALVVSVPAVNPVLHSNFIYHHNS
jgi:hypothetical protein